MYYDYNAILDYLFDKKYEVSQKWFITHDPKLMDEWDIILTLISIIQSFDEDEYDD